jgi:hypothetical protein
MSTPAREGPAGVERLQWQAAVVGLSAAVACTLAAIFLPGRFLRAYLAAYVLYLGIALGSMAILMLYHLTGGAWGFLIRRPLEAASRTLPLLAVLFLPLAFGVRYLYVWARPEAVAADKALQHKQIYLNTPFFWARAALYFVVWIGLAYLLSRWSRLQDEGGDARPGRRMSRVSAPGLVVYGITITFASVDWVMSLQPAFRSTIFGPVFASSQILSGHAFALVVLARLVVRPPVAEQMSPDALNDLGSLLFSFLVIWAYLVFFQFMLIWMANLPYEVVWYEPRGRDGWQYVTVALVLFGFAVPFFALLSRNIKRDPRALATVAGLILFTQLAYGYYQVLPAFAAGRLIEHWVDFVTPFAVGGLWLAYFLWQFERYPQLPLHDPNERSALQLRQLDEGEAARESELHHA